MRNDRNISKLPAEATEPHNFNHRRDNNPIRGHNTNRADWMNGIASDSLDGFHRNDRIAGSGIHE